MLALTTYKCIYHLNGKIVLYRISAGFSFYYFLCPFLNGITKAGFVLPPS